MSTGRSQPTCTQAPARIAVKSRKILRHLCKRLLLIRRVLLDPATQHGGVNAQIPGRRGTPVSVLCHQPYHVQFELFRVSFPACHLSAGHEQSAPAPDPRREPGPIFDYIERFHNSRNRRQLEFLRQNHLSLTQPPVELGQNPRLFEFSKNYFRYVRPSLVISRKKL